MAKKILPVAIICFVAFLIFYSVLGVYFSGDDFFHFKVAMTDRGLSGFVKLFGFYPFEERGIAFYRPIPREFLYNVFYSIFGLKHLPFRTLQILVHFVNIALVYLLFKKLFDNKYIAIFTSFFFGITAANVGALFYLAGGIQTQVATMFVLASLIVFENRKRLSFIFFVLALSSHELAVVTPILIGGLELAGNKRAREIREIGDIIKNLLPFFLLLLLYLLLNFFVIGFSQGESAYQPNFDPLTLVNTLGWYIAWSLGLPEMIVDFVGSGLSLNPNLMKFWGDYFQIIFPAFFGVIGVIGGIGFYLLVKKRDIFLDRRFWFLVVWFPVALLPVLFLPIHKKTYYLQPALPAFWGTIGFIVIKGYESLKLRSEKISGFFLGILVTSFFVLSFTSVKVAEKTYWAANRGRVAEKLTDAAKQKYPNLPKGATVYFQNDPDYPTLSGDWQGSSKQAYYALNGEDALQLLYKDPTLEVYYEDNQPDIELNNENVYQIVAEID